MRMLHLRSVSKTNEIFRNQKQLLDTFLEHGTISRAQYEKSLGDMIVKMGIEKNHNAPDKGGVTQ